MVKGDACCIHEGERPGCAKLDLKAGDSRKSKKNLYTSLRCGHAVSLIVDKL